MSYFILLSYLYKIDGTLWGISILVGGLYGGLYGDLYGDLFGGLFSGLYGGLYDGLICRYICVSGETWQIIDGE